MRFFKSFNLLHRRSKSDNAVAKGIQVPKTHVKTRSLSLSRPFFEQSRVTDVFDPLVPVADPKASIPIPSISPSLADRVHELEQDKAQLNCTIGALVIRVAELRDELMNARLDLHASLAREAYLCRQEKEDEDEIMRLEEKVARYARFIDLMVDIGLHEAVLPRACGGLRAGEDADEALIDSIKEAAAKPESPWSRIIPAVTGPRSPEEYISSINATLKVRRELKDCRKVAKFWKRTAKATSAANANIITPSVSAISSVQEVLSEERQTAVATLLAQRKSGSYAAKNASKRRSSLESNADVAPVPERSPAFVVFRDNDCQLASGRASTPTLSKSSSSKSTQCKDTSVLESSPSNLSYVPNLAPLASESFKKELFTSSSYKGVAKQITSSSVKSHHSRTVLGEVDLNHVANKSSLRASDSAVTECSQRSAKALGKRNALVVSRNIQPIEVSR
jgi:hypothetical protein